MKKKKKIVLIAHCLLNVNAKIRGIAKEPAGCRNLVDSLMDHGFGIIQLPCMEQLCFGINRWGQVKQQIGFPAFRARCREVLRPIVDQVSDFYQNGYRIEAVIGIDGSPTCGINHTCSGSWGGEIGTVFDMQSTIASLKRLPESGVMMEVLRQMLEEAGIDIQFLAVDEDDPQACTEELISKLC